MQPKTRPLPREEVAKIFPSPRARAAFEDMQRDIAQTIPDATGELEQGVSEAKTAAAGAQETADSAVSAAATAQASANGAHQRLDDGSFLTIAAEPTLESSKRLAVGEDLQMVDDGLGSIVLSPRAAALLASTVSEGANTFANAGALAAELAAGATYVLELAGTFQVASMLADIEFRATLAGATIRGFAWHPAIPAINTDTPVAGRWLVKTVGAGTAQLQFRTTSNGNAVSVIAGLCAVTVRRVQ